MTIAYVSNSRFPSERAHAIQIVQMCNAFGQQGNEINLFVADRSTNITESPETFYGTPFNFEIHKVSVPNIAGNIAIFPRFFHPLLYTIQRIWFSINVLKPIYTVKSDYIYGRDEWVVLLLSFFSKVPVVWESHEAKYSLVAKWLIQRSKKLIVISEGVRDFYIAKGVPEAHICVAHDAVDETFFKTPVAKKTTRARLGIEETKPVVMYIGGLDPWKGVTTLFDAAKEHTKAFSVFVIGGKPLELESFKTKYPWVTFLGPRPYKELRDCQQAADILVIPNTAKNDLSAKYTSPLKLFAHMTSKVPLLLSDIPSLRAILSDEQAYFFEADNPRSLAVSIEDMLQKPQESIVKAEAAFELSKKYTWGERAREIIKFLMGDAQCSS